jgi:hypothetical protein
VRRCIVELQVFERALDPRLRPGALNRDAGFVPHLEVIAKRWDTPR